MKIFLDTANLEDITYYKSFIDGVTTNPSIMSQYDFNDHNEIIRKICTLVPDHVSVEVISEKFDDMLKEGKKLASIHDQICIKLPCTYDGLRVCRILSSEGIATNLTLCFSSSQAILAAKCGATYISPFIGRLDDVGQEGITLIEEISEIYASNGFKTEILAASIRSVRHVIQSATIGVGAITMSPKILQHCLEHPLTDIGLKIFIKDWEKTNNDKNVD
jgi:transaldolase